MPISAVTASVGSLATPPWLGDVPPRIDALLEQFLTVPLDECPDVLQQAMRYACLSGGKRVRPMLVVASAVAAARSDALPTREAVWNAATAIEMLHAFSLVHDDLPAMDDDDLRRGKPTVHKQFDEATAILAGDALSVRAFDLLADDAIPPAVATRLVREVGRGIGWCGVIAGQVLDLAAEGQPVTRDQVDRIHRLKTAALMKVSCRCGGIAMEADEADVQRLSDFGEQIGLAFQAIDDLLDELADEQDTGKRVRKDRDAGKATLPAAVGLEAARATADRYIQAALSSLEAFGSSADGLRVIAQKVLAQI